MKNRSDFEDYLREMYPITKCRTAQGDMVKIELWDGVEHGYNIKGLLQMSGDELDRMYTELNGRRPWHLTRESLIEDIARHQYSNPCHTF